MTEKKGISNGILDAVGNTPLVQLKKFFNRSDHRVFAKLEFLNPMGSIKDRIAKYMIEKAEREGNIKNGQIIIENSSGNTALGLALVAIQKGYRLKVIVRDRISQEKINQLKALGVEIHLVDSSLPPESPDSYNNITPTIVNNTPDSYYPDQHNNRDNNEAHYHTTGPEIWEQMDGKIDYFITGIGTGGTLCGAGKYLKEKDPNIRVIGIDVEGSIFFHYFHHREITAASPYLLEGLGDEFLIKCADFDVLDDMYQVSDREAFLHARQLSKTEGILGGGSSGASMWGITRLIEKLSKPARIVTIFPDGASRYLSTIFNDQWMTEKGFL